jgi:hypothetical protein
LYSGAAVIITDISTIVAPLKYKKEEKKEMINSIN